MLQTPSAGRPRARWNAATQVCVSWQKNPDCALGGGESSGDQAPLEVPDGVALVA